MHKIPPHLPPPTCSIAAHRNYERIKLILLATVFGLLSGITGTLLIFGYFGSQILGADMWGIGFQNTNDKLAANLDDKVRIEMEDKIGAVYRDAVGFGAVGYSSLSNKIGDAVFITSDGWMAMYSLENGADYKKWHVLSRDGRVFSVEKIILDRYANLIYFKIFDKNQNNQFKVANFIEDISSNDSLFVFQNNNWLNTIFAYDVYHAKVLPHLDSMPNLIYKTTASATAGQIVVNASGKVVGFYTDDKNILPSIYLTRVLPTILSKQKAVYYSLGVEGWFGQEQPIVFNNERLAGFTVSRVLSAGGKLRVDDVLLEVKGQIVTPENLWYNIAGEKTVKIKILRKGKTQELETAVFQL